MATTRGDASVLWHPRVWPCSRRAQAIAQATHDLPAGNTNLSCVGHRGVAPPTPTGSHLQPNRMRRRVLSRTSARARLRAHVRGRVGVRAPTWERLDARACVGGRVRACVRVCVCVCGRGCVRVRVRALGARVGLRGRGADVCVGLRMGGRAGGSVDVVRGWVGGSVDARACVGSGYARAFVGCAGGWVCGCGGTASMHPQRAAIPLQHRPIRPAPSTHPHTSTRLLFSPTPILSVVAIAMVRSATRRRACDTLWCVTILRRSGVSATPPRPHAFHLAPRHEARLPHTLKLR